MIRTLADRFILPLTFVAAIALTGCSSIQNMNFYSTDEEVQLGQQLDQQIHKEMQVIDDSRLQDFLNERGQRLVAHAERKDLDYHFAVVKSDEVNAFAIPGGYCYVNTGLFKAVKDENELISVVAHEISHVTNQHSMKRLSQMQLAGLVSEAVLGNRSQIEQIAAQLFTSTGLLYYSREAEREADHDGLLMMYEAGYDPRGMVDMFKVLMAKSGEGGAEAPNWQKLFSTHPMTQERIDNSQQLIDKLDKKSGLVTSTKEWGNTLSYIRQKY